jgi:excisionase family DNA binding protein
MASHNHSTSGVAGGSLALLPPLIAQPTEYLTPDKETTSREAERFFERRRAQALGFEMPLTTREAAAYVGLHPKTVERMARAGDIPAHPVSGVRRKTWRFYPSELDLWLRTRLHSTCRPCSPDGKDRIE